MTRIEEEIALVLRAYPDLEFQSADLWARIPSYPLPDGIWHQEIVEVAFQFPAGLPGQQPYGFWVRPGLELRTGGTISSYTFPVTTPFGDQFGQFSWSPEVWTPRAEITAGTNMLDFVRSFSRRLAEGA
jgi:hypothetical protein